MNRWSVFCGTAALAVMFAQGQLVAQQTPPQKIDLSKLGPKVGERVPAFELKDQNGQTRNLDSIMGPKGAMLVFVRSADW